MNDCRTTSTSVTAVIAVTLFLSIFNARAAENVPPQPSAARLTPAVCAVRQALPWVVNIGTNQEIIQVNDPFNLFFTEFFGRARGITKTMQYSPLGSGVIVDPHGLVLTNSHVVKRAPQIEVRLWDGTAFPATVIGYDAPNDLCLLQLQGDFSQKPLVPADFARSGDLLLGESVIAIGNPFGLEHSVSQGVISAFNRSFTEDDISFDDIIQTDAAINPGNSGGPLVNLDGQLIGMNLAIRSDAQGICFAIPLARIEQFLSYWLKPSHFSGGYIGLAPDAPLERADDGGVILPGIVPDSPADKAGLRRGMTVTAINGQPVSRPIELSRPLWRLSPGEKVQLTADGRNFDIIVNALPRELLIETRLGLRVEPLTARLRQVLGLPEQMHGVVVTEIINEPFFAIQNARWRQIIKRGDIIASFNKQKITDSAELSAQLEKTRSGDRCQLGVFSINPNRRNYVPLVFEQLILH